MERWDITLQIYLTKEQEAKLRERFGSGHPALWEWAELLGVDHATAHRSSVRPADSWELRAYKKWPKRAS